MSEGQHTLSDIASFILVLAYITGVLFLIAGAVVRLIARRKKSEKLKNVSLALIAMGGVTVIFSLVYHVRLMI